MDSSTCQQCGKSTGSGEVYCPECQALQGGRRPKRFWIFSLIFSALLLFLTGMLLWHSGWSFDSLPFDRLWAKPAAVINGEEIKRSEVKGRVKSIRAMVERQYGRDIFSGERGRMLLGRLEQEVLDGMVAERLVAQEAKKLKIQIREEQVQQELQRISKDVYGSWEKFQARLKEDGVDAMDVQDQVRSVLIFEAVKAAKAVPGSDPEVSFNAWLIQARQRAAVVISDLGNRGAGAPGAGGGCCSPAFAGGCGGQRGAAGPLDPKIEAEASKAGLEAYSQAHPGEQGASAKVTNYGCHIQVDIQKEGKVVRSYTYQGGKCFEIS